MEDNYTVMLEFLITKLHSSRRKASIRAYFPVLFFTLLGCFSTLVSEFSTLLSQFLTNVSDIFQLYSHTFQQFSHMLQNISFNFLSLFQKTLHFYQAFLQFLHTIKCRVSYSFIRFPHSILKLLKGVLSKFSLALNGRLYYRTTPNAV